jgi:hypothetical protein
MVLVGATAGCDVNSALKQVSEARRLSAGLLVQFTRQFSPIRREERDRLRDRRVQWRFFTLKGRLTVHEADEDPVMDSLAPCFALPPCRG